MSTPKVVKFVHLPAAMQGTLEKIKEAYGISHTATMIRGIELAAAEIDRVADYTEVKKLYTAASAKRREAVV